MEETIINPETKNTENNFNDGNKVESDMAKKCPRCGAPMKKAGKIKAGPKSGLRTVYICLRCGYRSL